VAQERKVAVEAHQGGAPLLAAAGIDASRRHTDKGTTIILRQIPKGDVNNVSEGKPAQGKAKTADNTIGLPSGPNATSESDVRLTSAAIPLHAWFLTTPATLTSDPGT
jgi:hypothetical protein